MKISRYPDYKPRANENLESARKCADRIRKYWAGHGAAMKGGTLFSGIGAPEHAWPWIGRRIAAVNDA